VVYCTNFLALLAYIKIGQINIVDDWNDLRFSPGMTKIPWAPIKRVFPMNYYSLFPLAGIKMKYSLYYSSVIMGEYLAAVATQRATSTSPLETINYVPLEIWEATGDLAALIFGISTVKVVTFGVPVHPQINYKCKSKVIIFTNTLNSSQRPLFIFNLTSR
jgi:hypothetical protein